MRLELNARSELKESPKSVGDNFVLLVEELMRRWSACVHPAKPTTTHLLRVSRNDRLLRQARRARSTKTERKVDRRGL